MQKSSIDIVDFYFIIQVYHRLADGSDETTTRPSANARNINAEPGIENAEWVRF